MKLLLNALLSTTAAIYHQLWREKSPGALVVAPTVPGSRGDDAMLEVASDQLSRLGFRRIGLVKFGKTDDLTHLRGYSSYLDWPTWRDGRALATMARIVRYSHVFFIGADVLDGSYSAARSVRRIGFASMLAKGAFETSLLGFSFRKNVSESVCQAFRKLPANTQIKLRDPASLRRFEEATGRSAELVADLAFLLEPRLTCESSRRAVASISEWRAGGAVVVAVNLNRQVLPAVDSTAVEMMIEQYHRALDLIATGFNSRLALVMVPHDDRAQFGDESLCRALLARLRPEIQRRSLVLPATLAPAEIKGVVANVDAAISGRMHMAIACLGSGVPVCCVPYQDKSEGLFEHFNLQTGLFRIDADTFPQKVARFVNDRAAHTATIRSALPAIRDLAARNITRRVV